MVANHNGEMSDDGWLPMNAKINGQLHPTDADYAEFGTPGLHAGTTAGWK